MVAASVVARRLYVAAHAHLAPAAQLHAAWDTAGPDEAWKGHWIMAARGERPIPRVKGVD